HPVVGGEEDRRAGDAHRAPAGAAVRSVPAPTIDSFGGGGFRVSGLWRAGSLLILGQVARDWRPLRVEDLRAEDFAAVIEAGRAVSEFVLLGTGAVQFPPPGPVRRALSAAGLGLEFMASDAAARLHNILGAEGRRLATALIAI
ncbi:MAG: Mth938-like domain-containing protein, partial [Caulobacteraceae bacterium]